MNWVGMHSALTDPESYELTVVVQLLREQLETCVETELTRQILFGAASLAALYAASGGGTYSTLRDQGVMML